MRLQLTVGTSAASVAMNAAVLGSRTGRVVARIACCLMVFSDGWSMLSVKILVSLRHHDDRESARQEESRKYGTVMSMITEVN